MKIRAFVLVGLLGVALSLGGCDRPSEDECQRAVANIEKITGNAQKPGGPDPKAAVRNCRGRSTKKSVQCWIQAKDEADLDKCEKSKTGQ